MIELGKDGLEVPALAVGPEIKSGSVYVQKKNQPSYRLPKGRRVVLIGATGSILELTTLKEAAGFEDHEEGTFLSEEDFEVVKGGEGPPTMRLYSTDDVKSKIWSLKGIALILVTLTGLFSLVFGTYLTFAGESGTSPETVAERGEELLRWTTEPIGQASGQAAVAATRQREAKAQQCLAALRGGESEREKAGGVSCETTSPSFWHDKESATAVSAVVGLFAAVVAGLGAWRKFSFGQEPG